MVTIASSAVTADFASHILGIGIELTYGELHLAEDRAGIVVIAGLGILLGQAEMAGRKHELNLSFHTDDRENADGDEDVIGTDTVDKAAVKAVANRLGDRIDAHTAVTELTRTLDKLAIQADRLGNLDDDRGKGRLAVTAKVAFIKAEGIIFGIRAKDRDVLFTSVKNDLFIERGKTLKLGYPAAAGTSLERDAEIIADGDLIKALIEGDRFDIDISVYDLYAFTSDGGGTVDDLLRGIAEMDPHVLKAILVACRIEDLINTDAAQ